MTQPMHVLIDGGPTITDWITSITGALAFLAAAFAAWPVWRQLQMLVDDRQTQLATEFSMWIQYSGDRKKLEVCWSNSSSAPVYEVRGSLSVEGDPVLTTFERGVLGPTAAPQTDDTLTRFLQEAIDRVLRKEFGDEVDQVDRYGNPKPSTRVVLKRVELVTTAKVELTFRDAAGIAWRRSRTGELSRESPRKARKAVKVPG